MNDYQEWEDFDANESDSQISADEEKLLDELGLVGATRRRFLGQSIAGALGVFAVQLLAKEQAFAALARFARSRVRPQYGSGKRRQGRVENQRLNSNSRSGFADGSA